MQKALPDREDRPDRLPGTDLGPGRVSLSHAATACMNFRPLLLAGVTLLLVACATPNYQETSDAARRRQLARSLVRPVPAGRQLRPGDTVYRPNGTFTSTYQSVSPGTGSAEPARREKVHWSGKWRVENGQLIEDITEHQRRIAHSRRPPLVRAIGRIDADRLILRNVTGNVNAYARKRPPLPKVSFTEGSI